MDTIRGYIDRITFQNAENGFTVARLKEPHKHNLTYIVGIIPSLQVGETVECKGTWKNHPSHGRQFDLTDISVERPSNIEGIKKYLSSGLVNGIGPVYAKRIVDHFKEQTLDIIDKTPDRLLEIQGLGMKRLHSIKVSWKEHSIIRELMVFLQSYSLSTTYAQKIVKLYGEASIARIKEDPYCLARDIWGVGFKTADTLAQKMGLAKTAPERLRAGIEYVLSELSSKGHVCYPLESFTKEAASLLEVEADLLPPQYDGLVDNERIVCKPLDSCDDEPFIWLETLAKCEESIAYDIRRLKAELSTLRFEDIPASLSWVQEHLSIELADQQAQAVSYAMTEKCLIITGGAGDRKKYDYSCDINLDCSKKGNRSVGSTYGKSGKTYDGDYGD